MFGWIANATRAYGHAARTGLNRLIDELADAGEGAAAEMMVAGAIISFPSTWSGSGEQT